MTETRIRARIRLLELIPLIGREDLQARKKIKESWHWGFVGYDQQEALAGCVSILKNQAGTSPYIEVEPCLEALRRYEEEIKNGPGDENGYGGATVHELILGITDVAEGGVRGAAGILPPFFDRWFLKKALSGY